MASQTARAIHPEIYTPDLRIDRHKCSRSVPMQVLSLGMSRTGTSSIKAALQILGYEDCYHFFNIYTNVQDTDMWLEAFDAKYTRRVPASDTAFWRALFDKLLGHCAALTDAPANAFAPELIAAYPEAKVVLVDRDLDAWYESFRIVMESPFRRDFIISAFLDPGWSGRLHHLVRVWIECQFRARSKGDFERTAKTVYHEHYEEVRRLTPRERLLEYELGSEWGPLSVFLGVDEPSEVTFPRINEKMVMKQKMDVLGKESMGRAMRNLGFGVGALVAAGVGVWMAIK